MGLYRRALGFALPYWRRLGFVLSVSIFATLLGLAQPYFLKVLIDDAFLASDFELLVKVSALLFVVSIASVVLNSVSGYRYIQVSTEALFDIRLRVFRHLQTLSPQFYSKTPMGDILSRLNNDVSEIQRMASDTFLSLLTNLVFLVGTVFILILLDPLLFVLSIALLPPSIWVIRRYRQQVTEKNLRLRESSADIGNFLVESLLGIRETVASLQEEREVTRFKDKNDHFIRVLLDRQLTNYFASGIPGVLLSVSTLLVFLVGGHMVINGSFTMGSFVAFTAYQARLLGPLSGLMGLYLSVRATRASLERVFELLDEPIEVVEAENPIAVTSCRGEITFDGVCLDYGREPVLKDLSFTVGSGETTAIVGPSGVGKSTLVDLILRRIDPKQGRVLLDGVDITKLKLRDLRSSVVVVEQEAFLWNVSIEENIRYAKPKASEGDVVAAAKLAGIHEFITTLPQGYRTFVGERGLQLSAGQKQRIAIARAVVQDSPVLVFDEATSALDGEIENSITKALFNLLSQRTTILLSHRLQIVATADRVLVLEAGHIVQAGSVQSLLAEEGVFQRLFAKM